MKPYGRDITASNCMRLLPSMYKGYVHSVRCAKPI